MRTILWGKYSFWKMIVSGVPQRSVLAPVIFLVKISNINDNIRAASYMNVVVDYTKIRATGDEN